MPPSSSFSHTNCDKEVQTISSYTNEDVLKRKIKTLRQKLRRQKLKCDNMSELLQSLKKKGFIDDEFKNSITNNFNGKYFHHGKTTEKLKFS